MKAEITKKCCICNKTDIKGVIPICDICREEDAKSLLETQKYCKSHPGASVVRIALETGIPYKLINWYEKNGKLGSPWRYDKASMPDMRNKSIDITDTPHGDYIWLDVSGKIDSSNALIFQRYIDNLIDDEWTNIIIDMGSVTFFSSTGVRVVLSAYKKVCELDGSLHIINPSLNVKNVFGMVALDNLLF